MAQVLLGNPSAVRISFTIGGLGKGVNFADVSGEVLSVTMDFTSAGSSPSVSWLTSSVGLNPTSVVIGSD